MPKNWNFIHDLLFVYFPISKSEKCIEKYEIENSYEVCSSKLMIFVDKERQLNCTWMYRDWLQISREMPPCLLRYYLGTHKLGLINSGLHFQDASFHFLEGACCFYIVSKAEKMRQILSQLRHGTTRYAKHISQVPKSVL